jgi:hypothetical protein
MGNNYNRDYQTSSRNYRQGAQGVTSSKTTPRYEFEQGTGSSAAPLENFVHGTSGYAVDAQFSDDEEEMFQPNRSSQGKESYENAPVEQSEPSEASKVSIPKGFENESKEERFKRVVSPRLMRAVKQIEGISKCSNKSLYDYTEEDVDTMFDYLEEAVRKARYSYDEKFMKDFIWKKDKKSK